MARMMLAWYPYMPGERNSPEIERLIADAVERTVRPLLAEVAQLKKAAEVTKALAGIYQTFRLAFFKGQSDPLAFPNVDYLVAWALVQDIGFVRFDRQKNRVVLRKDGITVATDAYFYILVELYGKGEYESARELLRRPFVLYDLGMNRGYASLWFANLPDCRAVYGFELVESTYRFALDNFALNPRLAEKIQAFCVGLGGDNRKIDLLYEEATDGVATLLPEFYDRYWTAERKQRALRKTVEIRKASEALASLPRCTHGEMRVLKIDVEGAEYEILAELAGAGALDFDVIVAEAHLGLDRLLALVPGYRVVNEVRHSEQMANVTLVRGQ